MKVPASRAIDHASFAIERSFPVAVDVAFHAWSDPETKHRWFTGAVEWEQDEYVLEFEVGGHEHAGGGPPGGPIFRYDAQYEDIVPSSRIVMTYQMRRDGVLTSVSVATVEFEHLGPHMTKVNYTEQAAFLDRGDNIDSRRAGTEALFENLSKVLT